MASSSSITFVGDILPVRAPYHPPTRSLIGNFEGILYRGILPTHKAYTSMVDPKNLDRAFLEKCLALSVANNHTYDAGPEIFHQTVKTIRAAGVIPYGFRESPIAKLTVGKLHVGIIGCLEPCRSRGPELFRQEDVLVLIRAQKNFFDHLFVTPHWGKESELTPFADPRTLRLAHQWIKAGAAGVFGHHSHVLQGFSVYRDSPIYPSLGNFSFSHPQNDFHPITRLGLGVKVSFQGKSMKYEKHYFYDRKPLKNTREAEKYFADLSSLSYSNLVWARLIGKTYIKKSFSSWKLRLRRSKSPVEAAKFLVWLFLPKTLWMILLFPFQATPVLSALNRQYQKIGS